MVSSFFLLQAMNVESSWQDSFSQNPKKVA